MVKVKGKKSDSAEVEARVQEVYKQLVEGWSRAEILQNASQNWGVSDRQAATYHARAMRRLQSQLQGQRDQLLAVAIAQRNDLYRKCYEDKRWWHCLEIAKDRDQLLALYMDINAAIGIVNRAGFVVIDPTKSDGQEGDQATDVSVSVIEVEAVE